MLRTLYRGLLYGGGLFRGLLFTVGTNPTPVAPDKTVCLTGTGSLTVELTGTGSLTVALTGTGGDCT